MLTKTNEYKLEEGRGKGHGRDYKPWIETREVSSSGTCSNPIDWKTGRTVELLSQGESYFWHILRWNDKVDDIREQYPLDIETTLKICDDFNIKHPHDRKTYMTSDFYVTYKNGTKKIFSVKNSRDVLNQKRTKEKLSVEACYWKKYRNIDYKLVFLEKNSIKSRLQNETKAIESKSNDLLIDASKQKKTEEKVKNEYDLENETNIENILKQINNEMW